MNAVPKIDSPITVESLTSATERLLVRAKHYGADTADAVTTHGRSLSVAVRGGELEDVDNSEGRDIGLRVMVGQRQACVSSSDLSADSLDQLAERAVAMAKLAPEDPYCGLAPAALLCTSPPDLDLFDGQVMTPADLKGRAHVVEETATSVKGVMQAEGANANWATSAIFFMTSDGFARGWRSSRHGLSVSAIAEANGQMERDYDYDGSRWLEDLREPSDIGQQAGTRAVARLGAQQMKSGALPVLFDRRVSGALVSGLLGAINGRSIARGVSFLKDKMGKTILGDGLNIIDDPLMRRGHGSRPWDGEGVDVAKRHLVQDGVLQTWLLNTATAKQLDLTPTGHASRGIGAPPNISATNTYLENGSHSLEALIAKMGHGLYITEMFGPSLNSNTGDYSVGVAGFAIENGARSHAVSEVTIAGNLLDVWKTLTPANDLTFDGATVAPSLLTEGLTLAGT